MAGTKTAPNPYVGPRPFEQGEVLYGRDREIAELYYLLSAERVVLLHSPSGAGKTSLIQAGLIPRLRPNFDVWRPTRLNHEPQIRDIDGGRVNRYVLSAVQGLEEGVLAELRRPFEVIAGQSLAKYVAERPRRSSAPMSVVLIFDQFEEVLTVDPLALEAKREFFDQLGELLRDPEVWALFVLREEYLAALDPYAQQVPTHLKNRFRINLLGLEPAKRAITKPAEVAGREFMAPALEKLLHDLATMKVQQADGSFLEETGYHVEPVHLQVVCRRLWEQLPDDWEPIDSEDLGRFGDVTEALAAYYATAVALVADGQLAYERAIREWFSERLITESGIRSQVVRGADVSGDLANETVERLLDAHLIRAERRGGATWYELAHDRLLDPVRGDNLVWRQAHLSEVQRRASLWDRQGRLSGFLLEGEELARAELWAVEESELTQEERHFLAASREAQAIAERDRKQARRIRTLAIVSTIVSIVALVVSVIAGVQWLRAAGQKQETEVQKRRAEDLARATIASKLLADGDATLGNLVVLEVRQPDEAPTAVASLRKALVGPVEAVLLKGHTDWISDASFSPDGTQVVTASGDKTARIWDTQKGEEIATLKGHGSVSAASFSPDGSRVVAITGESGVIWDVKTGEELASLQGHTRSLRTVSFSPDSLRVVAASEDNTARIWNAHTGEELAILIGHTWPVFSASFSPDSARVVTASGDTTARIWNAHTGKEIVVLQGHTNAVIAAVYSQPTRAETARGDSAAFFGSSDAKCAVPGKVCSEGDCLPQSIRIVTASVDGTARVWNAKTGKEVAILEGRWVGFSPDVGCLLMATEDGTARILDTQTGEVIGVLKGHLVGVASASFSPDGVWVITVSHSDTVRIWNAKTGEEIAILKTGAARPLRTASFSPDNSQLVVTFPDAARIYTVPAGEEIAKLKGTAAETFAASSGLTAARFIRAYGLINGTLPMYGADGISLPLLGRSGSRAVIAPQGGEIPILNAETGEPITILKGHNGAVFAASFSSDGSRIVTASRDTTARIWNVQAGKETITLYGHSAAVSFASFSPDDSEVVTVSRDRTARIWNAKTGEEVTIIDGLAAAPSFASFSLDGALVVIGLSDMVGIWNAQTGKEIATLKGHTDQVVYAAFSSDGLQVVTTSRDRTARIWNAQTGVEVVAFRGHRDLVFVASFSPDGSRVVTASGDRTARIWNVQTGEEVATLTGHEGGLWAAAFSLDGSQVVTASLDGTVRRWANSDDYSSLLQSRIRARTRLCLDASFRWSNLGESAAEAERNTQACERCVPVFFERLGDAPASEWQVYEESWRVYRECLDRD